MGRNSVINSILQRKSNEVFAWSEEAGVDLETMRDQRGICDREEQQGEGFLEILGVKFPFQHLKF